MKRHACGSVASVVCITVVAGLLSLMIAGRCGAQAVAKPQTTDVLVSDSLDSTSTPAHVIADQPMPSDAEAATPSTPAPPVGEPTSDWHFAVSTYLWLPGVHGTVGALGHEASVHASPGDTGSLLDYQFGAVLGYRIKPAVVLQAGYRYLSVDYRSGGTTINLVTSGALLGATITLK
jgi:hypothetical protein